MAFGNNNDIQYVQEFVGGLNISQITSCEKKYEKLCPVVNAETALQGISQQWSCIYHSPLKMRNLQ